jgi:hypothetical protein
MFGPMKEAVRGRRFSSDEEVIGAVQKSVKDATKYFFFFDGIKNLLNAGTCAVKSNGITLKSNISFVSVYLK